VLEGHHLDADFLLVLAKELLGIVGAVEGLAGGILARPGVIAADDEMGAPPIRMARLSRLSAVVVEG